MLSATFSFNHKLLWCLQVIEKYFHNVLESKFVKSPPNKFFPPLTKFEPPYPIAPDCHLPNSAVLKELHKYPEDQEAMKKWKLPPLTAKQLELIKKHKVIFSSFRLWCLYVCEFVGRGSFYSNDHHF